jgi:gamma-glutamyltranspeptidase/glutathione hydrolase
VVAAGHPAVCDAAQEVLRAGGNAFDAVVGAGFAGAVVEPALTSLGGGGFLLARTGEAETTLFDFFVDTPGRGLPTAELEPHFVPVTVRFPASEQSFNVGLGSVAVPGNLKGLLHVHGRLGRLPLAEVVAPAVALSRAGVVLNSHQAYFLELLTPIMTLTEAARAIFEPAGSALCEGDRHSNPELASFLEDLPRGAERAFYEGELGERVASDMHAGQGLLTREDLAAYRVVERRPLELPYRGLRILTNPAPAFGGRLLALSLSLLESLDPSGVSPGSATHLHALATLMCEVDALRDDGWLAPETVPETRRHSAAARVRRASGGTTHVSVCDAEGNAASMTTSNGEGSGYLAPGTGVMLNNMLGEDDLHPDGFHASPPGDRVSSMMSPSLLLEGAQLRLAIGSGGSKRIRTALLQVLCAIIDFGTSVEEAVRAPRVHWDGATLQVEPGFSDGTVASLRQRWPVNVWPECSVYFGGVNAVSPSGHAAGDPRRGGAGRVV